MYKFINIGTNVNIIRIVGKPLTVLGYLIQVIFVME
jgi:hypothetical protein